MCGVQIGRQQLKAMLAHAELPDEKSAQACGLQVGHEELASILAHSGKGPNASAACGVQVGHTLEPGAAAAK